MLKTWQVRLTLLAILSVTAAAPAEYEIEVVADGLSYPWSIAFLPDGSKLVTERVGRLRMIRNGQLLPQAFDGIPPVYAVGQGGLFEVLLDPDFDENKVIYISYAHGNRKENATRVARAVLDGLTLRDVRPIFTVSPTKATPHHFGGRMLFVPDKTLLVTTGDGFNYRELAQRLDNLLGKVVRIRGDGSVPTDNPFLNRAGARPEIWSYGHRNPQGLVFDSDTGTVYLHEHGPRGGDEVNVIEPGLNYGWPAITYGVDYNFAQISPYTALPGMEQPLIYWVPSIAPAGMDYYEGDLFPEWRGDLLVAALAERSVRRLVLEDGKVVHQEILFADLGARMREVRVGPDGALYLLTDASNGQILRVTPR